MTDTDELKATIAMVTLSEEPSFADDEAVGHNKSIEMTKEPSATGTSNALPLQRGTGFHFSEHRFNKDLTWEGVYMTLNNKNKSAKKTILENVWGTARSGETTAIMGASGAGKTSLFNILTGRAKSRGNIHVQHTIRLNGIQVSPDKDVKVRHFFALVSQEDALHVASTAREALTFSARLRLPKRTTRREIDQLVDGYIQSLGLTSCADSVIGGGLKKGISGGEKRRTSIGIELISQPKTIFLDEPTSGLDSFAAKQVMTLLQEIAQSNTTVIFTIHQPSSDIFASFDNLILLNQGRVMYTGPTSRVAPDFAEKGFPMPPNFNPADWLLDVAQQNSIKTLERSGFFPCAPTIDSKPYDEKIDMPSDKEHVSMLTEFKMLVNREKMSLVRNPAPMIINVILTAFLSIISGVIFFEVGKGDRNETLTLQAQLGALINLLISTMMGQSQTALLIFSAERQLFLREYATHHYSIFPFVASHFMTEVIQSIAAVFVQSIIVFYLVAFRQSFFEYFAVNLTLSMSVSALAVWLGSLFSNPKVATSMFTPVLIPQFYFSGVFIPISMIPVWVRWGQWLCSLTYASRLAMIYEFGDCNSSACDNFLLQNNVKEDESWWYWMCLLGLFLLFRVFGVVTLRQKGLNFE